MLDPSARLLIGQYVPGQSLLHRANPFLKVVLCIVLMGTLFLFTGASQYGLILLGWVLGCLLSGLPFGLFLRGLRPLVFLLGFTALLHLVLTPGTLLTTVGPLTITEEGVANACHFSVRLLLLVSFTSLLTLTTSSIELTFAIEKLLRPFSKVGFPAQDFAMMLAIALRFVPVLFAEMDKIIKAQTCRGVDFSRGSPAARVRSYLSILVPLFVSAFSRALDLATAMEIRCYQSDRPRTSLREYPLSTADVSLALGTMGLVVLLALLPSILGTT